MCIWKKIFFFFGAKIKIIYIFVRKGIIVHMPHMTFILPRWSLEKKGNVKEISGCFYLLVGLPSVLVITALEYNCVANSIIFFSNEQSN